MAAPTPTTRVLPVGFKMKEGFKALITIANNPAIQFWEKEVQPPGWDSGEFINTTTQHNIRRRTFGAPALMEVTPQQIKVAYDPDCFSAIQQEIGLEQVFTTLFPDKSTLCYYAGLKSFKPDALKEKTQPEATIEIVPTSWDPVNNVEAAEVYTPAAGT
jgi:hypothetical protein